MAVKTVYYWVRSLLVLALGLFTIIFYFDDLQEFRFFFIPCFLAILAINACLLFGVKFKPRKIEKTIAIAYLLLFAVSLQFIIVFTGFSLFNWYENSWEKIAKVWISVLFVDYCFFWLAYRCGRFLLRHRSPIVEESTPEVSSGEDGCSGQLSGLR